MIFKCLKKYIRMNIWLQRSDEHSCHTSTLGIPTPLQLNFSQLIESLGDAWWVQESFRAIKRASVNDAWPLSNKLLAQKSNCRLARILISLNNLADRLIIQIITIISQNHLKGIKNWHKAQVPGTKSLKWKRCWRAI